MEELYDLMPEEYRKTLKLIKKYDEKLYCKVMKRISLLPPIVIDKIRKGDEFEYETDNSKTYFETFQNSLEFQHTIYGRYFNINMTINGFTERELLEDCESEEDMAIQEELDKLDWEEILSEHPELEDEDLGEKSILLVSFTVSNSQQIPETHYHFLEIAGESFLQNITLHGVEFDFAVFLEKVDDEFVLVKETRLNDNLVQTKKQKISFDELLDYVVDEDVFEEDFDYFD